ncbi:TPA: replication protein [Neisseria gonorrhoeae]|uniref:replication protein n=3 Tax=Neisseria gonorrhoeae TaxID=485 RepID=UPI0005E45EAA|nr:replication protein [Neisseria gonorrhoeae]MCF2974159.1 replication protein [Neisseria gonorrhoeae]MCF2978004.1 replication protein [Neisseria gonorrhoeae]MCF2993250.1 replication protein [Neisseria gonorrhoeae]MCF3005059.1 replication protein [Neisseria gonorrhoeae]MCF3012828.1 replication protein [Neisseria gonorrhoeae]
MKYIPNSFQIANAVVDDFLCRMSGNAWKCYAVIVRKTTGWQKEIDYISVSQFKNLTGIKTDVTVADALKELVELNLIASVKRHGQVTGYRINMPEPSPENGGTPPPENGGTATPKNWVHPKNGTTPKNWGVLPPENGGTTTPKNWGSTKHTTKPTNTKHSISASAAADAPLSAEPPETAPAAKAKKTGRHETELSLLAAYGITGQAAEDFLQVRKAKRQPLTETAMRLIAADAEKCGMTALQAAEYAIASGWGSFRADWLQNKTFGRSGNRGGPTHNQTAAVPDAGSYGDMPTTDF